MNIKPLYDRVVIKRLAAETTTKAGIIIPDNATEKSTQGEICAVGTGVQLDNGELRALTVKVGDRVIFSQYAGSEIKIEGETYLVAKESDILAIIDQPNIKEKAA